MCSSVSVIWNSALSFFWCCEHVVGSFRSLSATEFETALLLDYWPSELTFAMWVLHIECLRRRWTWSLTYFLCVSMFFFPKSDEHVMLPCSRSWTRTASLNLDCSFSQTCVANAHVTTSFVCFFFVDGSLDDSFMLVSLMVVPGHVDVVLCCLLGGICK